MPNNHEIRVELDQEKKYVVAHFPGPMNLGDTVRCRTTTVGGVADVYFDENGSPFLNPDGSAKTEIDSNDPPLPLEVQSDPTGFKGRCEITTSDGVVHIYNPIHPHTAGGNMVVR
jgi:hypothetical protein